MARDEPDFLHGPCLRYPAWRRIGHTVRVADSRRPRSLRLRTRVTLFFSLTALVASLALAGVTYLLARSFLVDQKTSVARAQTFANARIIRDQLSAESDSIGSLVASLRTETDGFGVLVLRSPAPPKEFVTSSAFQPSALPDDLKTAIEAGASAQQRFSLNGSPYVAVGVYIRAFDAQYYEAFPLTDTDSSLRAINTALGVGAGVTTLLAAGLGWWTSRRLLRPISRVAEAASELASGGLDTRMAPESDPDLARLAGSFNDMADSIQARIEREARFASDVSHELRSPITALAAAVEVLDGRRADLPERSQQALDLVVGQVRRFDQMVMDLLELSRIDAGSTDVHREEVDLSELVPRIAQRYGFGDVPVEIGKKMPHLVKIDKLRFERILANLLDNAREHAGGPSGVTVQPHGRRGFVLTVEDTGPGVARGERARIFERFARGSAARHRVGTGLGLALVAEHAQAHGGEAWVEDRPGGGALFKVSFTEVW
jgi:signal transduction histidine kinase